MAPVPRSTDVPEDPRPTRDLAHPVPPGSGPDYLKQPEATEMRLGWMRTVITPTGFAVPAEVCAQQDGTLVLRAPEQAEPPEPAAEVEGRRE